MELNLPSVLSVTPVYVALLGLMFIAITLRVGLYRAKNDINIGDGGDAEMLRRIRGHGNFVETVPIALFLLVSMELMGASDTWLHSLGAILLVGRVCHYVALTEMAPFALRPIGMVGTLLTILISSVWILVGVV